MGISINAGQAGTSTASGASTSGRAPDLDAKLNTARAQLEDWVTCASAKTPEGKAKIEQLTARLTAIQQQITAVKAKKDAQASSPDPGTALAGLNATGRNLPDRSRPVESPLGNRLDVYA